MPYKFSEEYPKLRLNYQNLFVPWDKDSDFSCLLLEVHTRFYVRTEDMHFIYMLF